MAGGRHVRSDRRGWIAAKPSGVFRGTAGDGPDADTGRDRETGDHLERIASYSTALATALRNHPKFSSKIDPAFVRLIGVSSALHDIGKVGIEDQILRKPASLTPDERRRMQSHALIGADC